MASTQSLPVEMLSSAFSLNGRSAVVTGAASGLGREIALCLARAGARVLASDIDSPGLETTCAEIREGGGEAWTQICNVADKAQVDAMADAALACLGSVGIWVNVAGRVLLAPVLETDAEAARQVLAVNALGVQFGCAAAGRVMQGHGGGVIVNISSGGGTLPVPGMATYCMSKAAVNQLTRVCAIELGPLGIRVNAVAPGWIETPMSSAVFRTPQGEIDPIAREAYVAQQRAASPLGILGSPMDVAFAVLYLVSDASRFVTGQVLTVNGGASF